MNTDEMTAKEKEMYETPDQWKGYGMCEKCRRQKYCKKTCSAHRNLMIYWIQKELFAELAEPAKRMTERKPADG